MKLEVVKIEGYPNSKQIHIKLMTANERLAMSAFHSLIHKTPTIVASKENRQGNWMIEIPDDFFEQMKKQQEDFNELVKQNPDTRIIGKTG